MAALTSNGCSKCGSQAISAQASTLLPNRPTRAALTKFKVIPSLFSAVNCKKQNRGSQAWSARICQGQQRQLEGSQIAVEPCKGSIAVALRNPRFGPERRGARDTL